MEQLYTRSMPLRNVRANLGGKVEHGRMGGYLSQNLPTTSSCIRMVECVI